MASKRRLRRNVCSRKRRYASFEEAQMNAGRAMQRSGYTTGWMHAYRCKLCQGWHIGHPPYRVKQAIIARKREASV